MFHVFHKAQNMGKNGKNNDFYRKILFHMFHGIELDTRQYLMKIDDCL